MARIVVEPHSASWGRDFTRLGRRLRELLGDRALRIDHIGSTAVPGLAAKDRIDVQIAVADLAHANPLGGAGFVELAPVADHRPPGDAGPASEWEKRFFQSADDQRRANIHVRVAGRANERYALLFRDYLRAHSTAVAAYAELKRRLATELRDIRRYAEVKDPACDLIIAAAEEWAAVTDWEPGSSDA